MTPEEFEIEREVFEELKTLTPRGTEIRRDQNLFDDLELLSDDASAMAFSLERKLRLRIPIGEWRDVFTVDDVIRLLARYSRE